MKNLFTILFLMFTSILFAQEQAPNSNFELWTDQYTCDGWNNSIVVGTPPFSTTIYTAQRTANSFQGSYAVEMETQELLDYVIPGLFQLGEIIYDGQNISIVGGYPFTDRPMGISVFTKYIPVDNDTAMVIAYMTKFNSQTSTTDTIAATFYPIMDTIIDYTELLMPFIYESEETPDTLNIMFLSSNPFNPKVGSTLYADSLQLLYEISAFPTLALPATNVSDTSFTANWIPSPYSNEYILQLATDSNFVNTVTGFYNIIVDTFNYDILIPEEFQNYLNYYYRVQVKYGDTATSIYSNVIKVLPTYPTVSLPATEVTQNSFKAHWLSMPGASSYSLDVATDTNFTSFVTGYENLAVSDTFYLVTGLNETTKYFYRVRTIYQQGTSPNSNTIVVSTLPNNIDKIEKFSSYFIRNNQLYLYNLDENSEIIVYDVFGKVYYKTFTYSDEVIIPFGNSGVYIVEIKSQKNIFRNKFTL